MVKLYLIFESLFWALIIITTFQVDLSSYLLKFLISF